MSTDEIDGRISKLTSYLDNAIDVFSHQIATLEQSADSHSSIIGDLGGRIDAIESDLSSKAQEIEKLRDNMRDVNYSVRSADGNNEFLNDYIKKLEARVHELEQRPTVGSVLFILFILLPLINIGFAKFTSVFGW
jgi:chromosome segregation ATPase